MRQHIELMDKKWIRPAFSSPLGKSRHLSTKTAAWFIAAVVLLAVSPVSAQECDQEFFGISGGSPYKHVFQATAEYPYYRHINWGDVGVMYVDDVYPPSCDAIRSDTEDGGLCLQRVIVAGLGTLDSIEFSVGPDQAAFLFFGSDTATSQTDLRDWRRNGQPDDSWQYDSDKMRIITTTVNGIEYVEGMVEIRPVRPRLESIVGVLGTAFRKVKDVLIGGEYHERFSICKYEACAL